MANVGFHGLRDESLTAAKGGSSASSFRHFETPGAIDDQTTHNKPDLLASTQTGIWNPVRSGSNHQNSINGRSTGGSQNQTAYTDNSRPHHNTTTEKRDPAATHHTQNNYYPPPTPTGSRDTRPGQKSGRRGTSPKKRRHKNGQKTN
ncbi:hypothetical protein RHGRI_000879 [Rhododendron griersonianum]|uniref:Uncharacterized protein n=1 Tax=Rhododendron griersonianum TaxID=479676 RepID=A0AAV6LJ91_9ERIC|nr:hypothetical protein RHGRI_000879 [Rhododendron griersonianum]